MTMTNIITNTNITHIISLRTMTGYESHHHIDLMIHAFIDRFDR